MNRGLAMASTVSLALRVLSFAVLASGVLCACSSDSGQSGASAGNSAGGSPAAAGGASGAAMQSGGVAGALATEGGAGTGGAQGGTSAGAGAGPALSGSGGALDNAGGASAGTSSGAGTTAGGTSGSPSAGGSANMAGASSGAAGGPPSNCDLPTPVSFQKNIQGFLTTSCGKAAGGGCHVTDTSKTSLGYDHAYDWITAIAHTSSCGKTMPYAKRFEVVLAVINGANPPSCPNSRKMPPAGTLGPQLTTCQVAALTAWLAEPMVSQMHVPETDDTANMYPAGPYLMPPFN